MAVGTRFFWSSARGATLLAATIDAFRARDFTADESNITSQELWDGKGPQYGPGTQAVKVSWTAQTCGIVGCGAKSYKSLTFHLGTATVNNMQYRDTSIRRVNDNECLSDCKVTGSSCNSMLSAFQRKRAKKFYVAGTRETTRNPMVYWDYKLCCEVSECSSERSWTVNYEVSDPPQPVHIRNFELRKHECMCCDTAIQCETSSERGSPLWEADKRCADKVGLTRVEQLNEHCEAAFKVRSAPIKVKTELVQYFKGTATITQEVWWDRCVEVCAKRDRNVPKTASWSR